MIIEAFVILNPVRLVPTNEKWGSMWNVAWPLRKHPMDLLLWPHDWGAPLPPSPLAASFPSSVCVRGSSTVLLELRFKSYHYIVALLAQKRVFFSLPPSPWEGTVFIALIRAWSCRRKCKSAAFPLSASNWGGNLGTFCRKKCQLDHQCCAANS